MALADHSGSGRGRSRRGGTERTEPTGAGGGSQGAFPSCRSTRRQAHTQQPKPVGGRAIPPGERGRVPAAFFQLVVPGRIVEVEVFFRSLWEIGYTEAVVGNGAFASKAERSKPESHAVRNVHRVANFSEKRTILGSNSLKGVIQVFANSGFTQMHCQGVASSDQEEHHTFFGSTDKSVFPGLVPTGRPWKPYA